MSVKKIFITLIVIVACVIVGALVLNVLMPNATTAIVDAVEAQIHNATGMEFDFNGNGTTGSGGGQSFTDTAGDTSDDVTGAGSSTGVEGIN